MYTHTQVGTIARAVLSLNALVDIESSHPSLDGILHAMDGNKIKNRKGDSPRQRNKRCSSLAVWVWSNLDL